MVSSALEPRGTVTRCAATTAWVRVDNWSCARCNAGRGCGAGILAPKREESVIAARIPRGVAVEVGDRVSLTLLPPRLLHGALLMYGLPLLGLLLALSGLTLLHSNAADGVAAFVALGGLVMGGVLGASLARRGCTVAAMTPNVAAVVGGE